MHFFYPVCRHTDGSNAFLVTFYLQDAHVIFLYFFFYFKLIFFFNELMAKGLITNV